MSSSVRSFVASCAAMSAAWAVEASASSLSLPPVDLRLGEPLLLGEVGDSRTTDDGAPKRCRETGDCPEPEPDPGEACFVVGSIANLNVPDARVSGAFRINGASPMWLPQHNGTVELRSSLLGTVVLGQLFEGGYERVVIPGTYDVVYRHAAGALAPQNAETVVMRGVVIDEGATIDIDIPAVIVSGTITVGGQPAPASVYNRGEIRLVDRETGASFRVGVSHNGSYSALVVPGTYDLEYRCQQSTGLVPINGKAILAEGVVVTGASSLHVDIPFVQRAGSFQIGGVSAPNSVYENGEISLRDLRTGDVFKLGETRDASYSRRIIPGTYDVIYSRLLGGSIVPVNAFAVVMDDVALKSNGRLTVNVETVAVSGELTLDGGPYPASIYNRGRVSFVGADPADVFEVGDTLDGEYSTRVVPGTYDIVYEVLQTTGIIPHNGWAVVASDQPIVSGGGGLAAVDIDVVTGWLDPSVTIWGIAAPASIYERGVIEALDPVTGDRVELLSTHDDDDTLIRVVAGAYGLRYGHVIGTQVPLNADAHVGGVDIGAGATVAVQVELQPGALEGLFTYGDWTPFPGIGLEQAHFSLRDVVTGDVIPLGSSFAGGYDVTLQPGSYDVLYTYQGGNSIPSNVGARLKCITFEPQAP